MRAWILNPNQRRYLPKTNFGFNSDTVSAVSDSNSKTRVIPKTSLTVIYMSNK
jgi:hypothetical protein